MKVSRIFSLLVHFEEMKFCFTRGGSVFELEMAKSESNIFTCKIVSPVGEEGEEMHLSMGNILQSLYNLEIKHGCTHF